MTRKRPEGWRNKRPDDPRRHALSAKGIPTASTERKYWATRTEIDTAADILSELYASYETLHDEGVPHALGEAIYHMEEALVGGEVSRNELINHLNKAEGYIQHTLSIYELPFGENANLKRIQDKMATLRRRIPALSRSFAARVKR